MTKGNLAEGKIADVTIIDPEVEYTIDKNKFRSMGKNTPFHGRKVFGEVEMTICGGKIVYAADPDETVNRRIRRKNNDSETHQ